MGIGAPWLATASCPDLYLSFEVAPHQWNGLTALDNEKKGFFGLQK